ncbi:MAG: hypothetical protein P8010_12800 [Desulfosarcinaceae bacterium]|jgi:hypothetical protein
MSDHTDMRLNQRAGVTADISVSHFSSAPTSKCRATVLNWSDCGLCFKAPRPLNPGQCIYIRTTQAGEKGVGLRSASLAEVRWCDQNPDPCKVEYIIGASYL